MSAARVYLICRLLSRDDVFFCFLFFFSPVAHIEVVVMDSTDRGKSLFKSQDQQPIDFSIKCPFCLWHSVIVNTFFFTLEHEHSVPAPSEGCALIGVSPQQVDHWFLPRPSICTNGSSDANTHMLRLSAATHSHRVVRQMAEKFTLNCLNVLCRYIFFFF